jgi:hypothetical protein
MKRPKTKYFKRQKDLIACWLKQLGAKQQKDKRGKKKQSPDVDWLTRAGMIARRVLH